MYMAEFKFKFIYKCIIICIDCFVVNKNFVLLNPYCVYEVLLRCLKYGINQMSAVRVSIDCCPKCEA